MVKDKGYEETHPEIKKIKKLVDVDVDTYDVITEEDLICYKQIQARFNLEAERGAGEGQVVLGAAKK